jgi:hypothetical protein
VIDGSENFVLAAFFHEPEPGNYREISVEADGQADIRTKAGGSGKPEPSRRT